MSTLKEPLPAKLISSVIIRPEIKINAISNLLETNFGPIDYKSPEMDFTSTNYYEKEMGSELKRHVISFEKLIKRDNIASIKLKTHSIEKNLSDKRGKRKVNIDPGYMAPEHLILVTGKGYAHRPYLGSGVYADLTLIYRGDDFHPLEWTYPDYNKRELKDILLKIRKIYINQLKQEGLI